MREAVPARPQAAPARARGTYALVVALSVLSFVAVLVAVALGIAGTAPDVVSGPVNIVVGIGCPLIALAVLRRQPDNRFVWVFLVIGLSLALYIGLNAVAELLWASGRVGAYAAVKWTATAAGEVGWPLLWVTPYLYPTGRPLPGWWRWAFGVAVVWAFVSFSQLLFSTGRLDASWRIDNPLGLAWMTTFDDALERVARPAFLGEAPLAFLVVFGIGAASLLVRFRRGTRLERAQIKAFAAAMAAFFVLVVASTLAGAAQPYVIALAAVLLPASMALAILRFRLYDLDRLISRTVTYALLTGILVAVYLGCVTLTTRGLGFETGWSAAVATLVLAALFQPLRHVLQGAVDRRFHRARYDSARLAEDFGGRLRTEVSTEAVASDLLATVRTSLAPSHAGLWLVERDR